MIDGIRRGNSDAVGSCRLVRSVALGARRLHSGPRMIAIKRLELDETHPLDVAANAPFAEAERHPRLELRDDARLHLGMVVQIEVQAVRPAVHQRLEPLWAGRVLRLQAIGIDEQLHTQVAIDLSLSLGFGKPAHRVDVVRLDAIEVVLGLRVHEAENGVGVTLAVNVRDAPGVASDRDVPRLALATYELRTRRLSWRGGHLGRGNNAREILHDGTDVDGRSIVHSS